MVKHACMRRVCPLHNDGDKHVPGMVTTTRPVGGVLLKFRTHDMEDLHRYLVAPSHYLIKQTCTKRYQMSHKCRGVSIPVLLEMVVLLTSIYI